MSKWTQFWDMHSGGGQKEDFAMIYIEAPIEEAKVIFYNRFGHSADRVSCTCCGDDYSVSESDTLEEATAYHRHCTYAHFNKKTGERYVGNGRVLDSPKDWQNWEGRYLEEPQTHEYKSRYVTLKEHLESGDILVIREEEIEPEERVGDVPSQGYVWVD